MRREPKPPSRRSSRDGAVWSSSAKNFLFMQVRVNCANVNITYMQFLHSNVYICVSPRSDLPSGAQGPKQEVICLDSSGDEGEDKEAPPPQSPTCRDGKITYYRMPNVTYSYVRWKL